MGLLGDSKPASTKPNWQRPAQARGLLDMDYETARKAAELATLEPGLLGSAASAGLTVDDLRQGNYGTAALNALGLLPFLPSLGGVIKNSTVPVMSWATWEKHFPNIPSNESYEMFKQYASNHVAGVAQELVDKLRASGIEPSGTALNNSVGPFKPYAYGNSIGGLSSYMHVPGYGEVRISDHMRSSGLGNDRTFGNSDDAFNAIQEGIQSARKADQDRQLLRESIGITDDMGRKERMQKLQNWIAAQGFKGKDKDLYPWINKAGL